MSNSHGKSTANEAFNGKIISINMGPIFHGRASHNKRVNLPVIFLVGGLNPSEKESQLGPLFPIYGNIVHMFQSPPISFGLVHETATAP